MTECFTLDIFGDLQIGASGLECQRFTPKFQAHDEKSRAQPPMRSSLEHLREKKRRESSVAGYPFYSGRELTGDRQPNPY